MLSNGDTWLRCTKAPLLWNLERIECSYLHLWSVGIWLRCHVQNELQPQQNDQWYFSFLCIGRKRMQVLAKRNPQKNFPCHCVWSWLHQRTYRSWCTFCTRSFSESGWKFPPGAWWPPSWCTRPLPRVRGGCAGRLGRVCTISFDLGFQPRPCAPTMYSAASSIFSPQQWCNRSKFNTALVISCLVQLEGWNPTCCNHNQIFTTLTNDWARKKTSVL